MFKILLSTTLVFFLLKSTLFSAELKIYTNEEPPLNFRGQDNQVTGFAVDIVQEILKRTATNSKINLLTWARGYQYLQREENVFLFSMAQTDQRKSKFKWVGPLATKRAILIAKKKSGITITTLEDAKKVKKIGTLIGDSKKEYLQQKGFTNLHSTPKWEQVVKMLMRGRVDLLALTDVDFPIIAKKAGINISDLEVVYTMYQYHVYIGVSKQTPEQYINQWQKTLDSIKSDGTFEKIINKWGRYYNSTSWVFKENMLQFEF